MNVWQTPMVIGFLFVLRCLTPMLLILLIGYGMNKVSDRMALQEKARRAAEEAAEEAQVTLFGHT